MPDLGGRTAHQRDRRLPRSGRGTVRSDCRGSLRPRPAATSAARRARTAQCEQRNSTPQIVAGRARLRQTLDHSGLGEVRNERQNGPFRCSRPKRCRRREPRSGLAARPGELTLRPSDPRSTTTRSSATRRGASIANEPTRHSKTAQRQVGFASARPAADQHRAPGHRDGGAVDVDVVRHASRALPHSGLW